MLYMGYLMILNGHNTKKPVSDVSIFEPPRLENRISRLCPNPLGSPPPPPPTHKEGLNHALHRRIHHCECLEYQKKIDL